MAKITAPPTATPSDRSRFVPVVQQGVTRRMTMAGLAGAVVPSPQNWHEGERADPGGTTIAIGLFTAASTLVVLVGTDLVRTSGYATVGVGPADYVNDALATSDLLERYPKLCFQSANRRIFRFSGTILHTAQAGAVGKAGINDQPAIQQCLSFANAVSILFVQCSHATYAGWCPERLPGLDGLDPSGVPFVIQQNLRFMGAPGGTTFYLLNSQGGPRTIITQHGASLSYDRSADWLGGGLYVRPTGTKMDWIILTDIHMDGGIPYTPIDYQQPTEAERSRLNLTDKGFRIQDSEVSLVQMERCSFRNFAGEVYYIGGTGVHHQDIQDSTFEGSPQCAMNPGTIGTFYFRNVNAGKAYQNEMEGGRGGQMPGCRFYDLYSMSVFGGPDPEFGSDGRYYYAFPIRNHTSSPPFIDLSGTIFARIGTAAFSSWCIGDITTVDTTVSLIDTGELFDVNLRINAWADLKNNFEAVNISGPTSLTRQVSYTPAGTYMDTPRQCRVDITCHRTALAAQNGRSIQTALRIYGGLIKDSCQFTIDGELNSFFEYQTHPIPGFSFPRIDIKPTARPLNRDFGSNYGAQPSEDFILDITPGVISIQTQIAGTFTMTATNLYALAPGQRVRFVSNAPLGRAVRIAANAGGNISLSGDRILDGLGSYLELEAIEGGGLVERGFSTQRAMA